MTSLNVGLLSVLVVVTTVATAVDDRDFNEPGSFECPSGGYISFIGSPSNNHQEDRQWKYECQSAPAGTRNCAWSDKVYPYHNILHYTCPDNQMLTGTERIVTDHHEYRYFKFQCCSVDGHNVTSCVKGDPVNDWNESVSFRVRLGQAIKGVYGYFFKNPEDRRWSFQVCCLQQ